MKTIRRSVFETNSSSTHSISICGDDKYCKLSSSNTINGEFGEFGWGYEKLNSIYEKLSYILTMIQYKIKEYDDINIIKESNYYQWLSEMIKEQTGSILELDILDNNYFNLGYIDHQSTDTLDDFWSDEESEFKNNMKEIIFNNKYIIVIDNDNH